MVANTWALGHELFEPLHTRERGVVDGLHLLVVLRGDPLVVASRGVAVNKVLHRGMKGGNREVHLTRPSPDEADEDVFAEQRVREVLPHTHTHRVSVACGEDARDGSVGGGCSVLHAPGCRRLQ